MAGNDQLFRDLAPRVHRFVAARVRDRDDADDVVQETFLRFHASGAGTAVHHPLGYLCRTAVNVIIDRGRRRSPLAKAADLDAVADDQLCVRAEQEDAQGLADLKRAYAAALAELSPRCAEVFHLRRHCEMATPDVARRLSITTRMVQKHMVAAMAHLHDRLYAYVAGDDGPKLPASRQIAASSAATSRTAGSAISAA